MIRRSLVRRKGTICSLLLVVGSLASLWSCIPIPAPGPSDDSTVYNNSSDPTNSGAVYIGSGACRTCHATIDEYQRIHGHGHKLTRVQGEPPEFPEEGVRAGVPNPPEGFDWSQISYVIGGYIRKARFIDNDGYILTTGLEGVPTQWNLSFPNNGTSPGFVAYEPAAEARKPYDFACFTCHTTGAKPRDEDFPELQENRQGFLGTWEEAGVQCEACHGPGSNHIPRPDARDIFVDLNASACGQCHTRGSDPNVIKAEGGYIKHHEQWPELLASGAHATFRCVNCHEPHRSTNYDRPNAIRTECTACHVTQTMAIHDGKVFVRDDYTETLSCESCHMPYVTKSATAAGEAVVGNLGRMGDTKTHIFRINTQAVDYTRMFTDDGKAVAKDSRGRAAVTTDFVCLRCHNGIGSAFELTIELAAAFAEDIHNFGQ